MTEIRFFDEDDDGISTRTIDMLGEECERCGEPVYGSHWHCARCDSKDVTSMLGHYIDGRYICEERGGNVTQ